MGLPAGRQLGFVAQQVDTVLPELVTDILHPKITDSTGAVLMDTMSYKAMNYIGLIPLAIRGIQELDSLSQNKVTVCSVAGTTPPNNLAKWDSTNKELCNSIIYDDGSRIGIPVTAASTYINVAADSDSTTANFSSDFSNATSVVAASYSTDGNANEVAAVNGYSKYIDADSKDGGRGGYFEGGFQGVYGLANGTGANKFEAGVVGGVKMEQVTA